MNNSALSQKARRSEKHTHFNPLQPLRHWLDNLDIADRDIAQKIARWIPSRCPLERDLFFLGHKVAHIPPLCKLNPLYEQFVGLRYRALCYLADQCGEDISTYL